MKRREDGGCSWGQYYCLILINLSTSLIATHFFLQLLHVVVKANHATPFLYLPKFGTGVSICILSQLYLCSLEETFSWHKESKYDTVEGPLLYILKYLMNQHFYNNHHLVTAPFLQPHPWSPGYFFIRTSNDSIYCHYHPCSMSQTTSKCCYSLLIHRSTDLIPSSLLSLVVLFWQLEQSQAAVRNKKTVSINQLLLPSPPSQCGGGDDDKGCILKSERSPYGQKVTTVITGICHISSNEVQLKEHNSILVNWQG